MTEPDFFLLLGLLGSVDILQVAPSLSFDSTESPDNHLTNFSSLFA